MPDRISNTGPRPAIVKPDTNAAPKSNNDVLLVGMNEHTRDEAAALRKRGVKVTFIGDSFAGNDKINVKDTRGRERLYDLTNDQHVTDFAMSLGLPGEQTTKIVELLKSAGPDAKDEIALLIREFAKAEKGGTIPSRFVLSGHNVGSGVWGDNNGKVTWDLLGKLTDAMPRAARQIEDLHIAACYSGGQPAMERYRAMFPNVKTIWAYSGSAPGSWSGAMTHQARWDSATRGSREELNRSIAENSRKGENVAVWSEKLGYVDGKPPAAISDLRAAFESQQATYQTYVAGDVVQASPQEGPLRDAYNQLQRLIQHPELPAAERPALEAQRDQAIRLLYYQAAIAPKFQACYGDRISEGFTALGISPAPNFATLSRKDALAQVAAFEAKLAAANPKPELAAKLLPILTEGLRELSPSRIPETWV